MFQHFAQIFIFQNFAHIFMLNNTTLCLINRGLTTFVQATLRKISNFWLQLSDCYGDPQPQGPISHSVPSTNSSPSPWPWCTRLSSCAIAGGPPYDTMLSSRDVHIQHCTKEIWVQPPYDLVNKL